MPAPIGLQLYTVRRELERDFTGTIERIAAIGYSAIEVGGETLLHDAAKAQLFKSLGFSVPSAGISLPLDDTKRAELDTLAAYGCQYVGIFWLPPEQFQHEEQIQHVAERLNAAANLVKQHGLTLFYHNHWFEFTPLPDGRVPHEILRSYTDPAVHFEIDVYWAQVGGTDPISTVRQLGPRAPLLHIKDGPAVQGQPMTAVGSGSLNIPAIIEAGAGNTRYLIVELDECATDMLTAVEESYRYLISNGLARGNRSV